MTNDLSFQDFQEEQYSVWVNPLPVDQRILLHMHGQKKPTRFIVPAGGEKAIPSIFDHAIHRVRCDEADCRNQGSPFCQKGHPGVVMGGEAPQLVKKGVVGRVLAEALNTEAQKQAEAAAAAAAAAMAVKAGEQALLIAAQRMSEANGDRDPQKKK